MKITLKTSTFELKENTKTVYQLVNVESNEIDSKQYKNYENSVKFFRRLGGTETIERSYTCRGYLMTKLTSKSPDKQTKIIREFNIF